MLEEIFSRSKHPQGFGSRVYPFDGNGKGSARSKGIHWLANLQLQDLHAELCDAGTTSSYLEVLKNHGFGQTLLRGRVRETGIGADTVATAWVVVRVIVGKTPMTN